MSSPDTTLERGATRDEARVLFSQTMGLVAVTAALFALGAYILNAAVRKRPLRATAFLPFGLFLAPAIWIGWLVEALLNWGDIVLH